MAESISFLGPSYIARSQFLDGEETINLMFEAAPEGHDVPGMLIGTAGTDSWATIGTDDTLTCRGMTKMSGVLYAVYGTTLYSIATDGTETSRGTVEGTAQVVFANNGIQLVIVADTKSYYFDADLVVFAQITDADFLQASSVTYSDGYFIFSQTDSWVFFLSDGIGAGETTIDFTAFDGADYSVAYTHPDNIVRVISDHKEVWVFKQNSTEIWQNTGEADFPYSRLGGAYIERGCAAKHSVISEDNSVIWLGDDRVVYRAQGYIPQRISTSAVEAAICDYETISDAIGDTWVEFGHKLYSLKFPTERVTWVYDFSTQLWHKRQSFELGYWRAQNIVNCYGKWLVGDSETNKIGELKGDVYTEYGGMVQAIRIGKHLTANGQRFSLDKLYVRCESGVGLVSGQGSSPQIALFLSKDYGKSYGTQKNRGLGALGMYRNQAVWRSQGLYRSCTPKLLITDPVKRVILAAYAEITPRAS